MLLKEGSVERHKITVDSLTIEAYGIRPHQYSGYHETSQGKQQSFMG